jgi:hypothetical protein
VKKPKPDQMIHLIIDKLITLYVPLLRVVQLNTIFENMDKLSQEFQNKKASLSEFKIGDTFLYYFYIYCCAGVNCGMRQKLMKEMAEFLRIMNLKFTEPTLLTIRMRLLSDNFLISNEMYNASLNENGLIGSLISLSSATVPLLLDPDERVTSFLRTSTPIRKTLTSSLRSEQLENVAMAAITAGKTLVIFDIDHLT